MSSLWGSPLTARGKVVIGFGQNWKVLLSSPCPLHWDVIVLSCGMLIFGVLWENRACWLWLFDVQVWLRNVICLLLINFFFFIEVQSSLSFQRSLMRLCIMWMNKIFFQNSVVYCSFSICRVRLVPLYLLSLMSV